VPEKRQQYKSPPESGSIVVHDDGEVWDLKTPSVSATDVKADGRALKRMAAVSTGTPLHYLSDEENANLATAKAMEEPTNRHYARRQRTFSYILRDLAVTAYNTWQQRTEARWQPRTYSDITATVQEIVRSDNNKLASAARDMVTMLAALRADLAGAGVELTPAFNRRTLELALKFAGEILGAQEIDALMGTDRQGQAAE
jgi:hypothetical protein